MRDLQSAESIHYEYRTLVNKEAQVFNDLKTAFPMRTFPKHACRVWRYGLLAEIWAVIATQLSPDHKDYLQNWRTGK